MKNKDKITFINEIYVNLIPIILKDTDKNYQKEISDNYKKKLINQFATIEITKDNYDKLYDAFVKVEKDSWLRLSANQKMNMLVNDPVLEEIIDISNASLKYAQNRETESIILLQDDYFELANKLEELVKKVKYFNKGVAEFYVSEGLVDLMYASGKSDNTSLRFH